jgi:sugar phosphate isomerase/epimerase
MPPKHPYPFRLSTTSYIIQSDLVANAQALAPSVDDMELVLFDSPAGSNLPDEHTIDQLCQVAAQTLTFSLHLPTHLHLAANDPARRQNDTAQALALLKRCASLPLSSIVAHVEGDEPTSDEPAAWERWRTNAQESLEILLPACAAPLCIENIERYHIEHVLPVVNALDLHLCLDVGHCWKVGRDPLPLLTAHHRRIPVIHLHGWDGQHDHQALTVLAQNMLCPLLTTLQQVAWCGVLTLEVFEADFWSSLPVLTEAWRALPGSVTPLA